MKHIFVVNPSSHSGQGRLIIPVIEKLCKQLNVDYQILISKSGEHLREIPKNINEGSYRLYSVGGDGTANILINSILPNDIELAIIPTGSGNDFVRTITGNNLRDLEAYITDVITGETVFIDIPTINDQYFINITSIGIDALVNENLTKTIKRFPWIPIKLSYYMVALFTILKDNSIYVNIKQNGGTHNKRITLLAIANGSYYGAGIRPCPDTSATDELFDLCLVDAMPLGRLLKLFPKYMKNTHYNEKEVSLSRSNEIEITSDKHLHINIDGETFTCDSALFKIGMYKQRLIVPPWSPLLNNDCSVAAQIAPTDF